MTLLLVSTLIALSGVAAGRHAKLVASRVGRDDVLGVYLAAVPFTNGDAWEVLR